MIQDMKTSVEASFAADKYEFRKRGQFWEIRFGDEEGFFRQSQGIFQAAQLLANPGVRVESIQLSGLANVETLALANSHKRYLEASADEVVRAHQHLVNQRDAAIANGDAIAAETLDEQITVFLERCGGSISTQRDSESLGATIHRAVAKNRKRLHRLLEKQGLTDCARYLERTIRAEGWAFAYRPLPGDPRWRLW